MPHLALYTFGVLSSPLADPGPLTRDLHDSGEVIYQRISRHPGYLAHAEPSPGGRGAHFDLDWGVWGEFAVPPWYGKGRTAETVALATTLSLWTDARSAFDAVYTGLHREALARRSDWFERSAHPNHVFWWVREGVIPLWRDGVSRLEHLQEHGATPDAFTFHHSFDPEGTPTRIKGIGPESGPVR
ncbi:DUF3291 domain-containing protein [Streptomyces sp. NPDC096079]|uniref:DUF3291 domain-containing protein n=1 Tax=unclassified Streptomyces TaxID=2593676 RepID=UPI00332E194E